MLHYGMSCLIARKGMLLWTAFLSLDSTETLGMTLTTSACRLFTVCFIHPSQKIDS